MAIRFEWDREKAARNRKKHGVTFDEASAVFGDPLAITIGDPLHSHPGEERFVTLGQASTGRLLVVVHLERGDGVRIITARLATPREKKSYEEGSEKSR